MCPAACFSVIAAIFQAVPSPMMLNTLNNMMREKQTLADPKQVKLSRWKKMREIASKCQEETTEPVQGCISDG